MTILCLYSLISAIVPVGAHINIEIMGHLLVLSGGTVRMHGDWIHGIQSHSLVRVLDDATFTLKAGMFETDLVTRITIGSNDPQHQWHSELEIGDSAALILTIGCSLDIFEGKLKIGMDGEFDVGLGALVELMGGADVEVGQITMQDLSQMSFDDVHFKAKFGMVTLYHRALLVVVAEGVEGKRAQETLVMEVGGSLSIGNNSYCGIMKKHGTVMSIKGSLDLYGHSEVYFIGNGSVNISGSVGIGIGAIMRVEGSFLISAQIQLMLDNYMQIHTTPGSVFSMPEEGSLFINDRGTLNISGNGNDANPRLEISADPNCYDYACVFDGWHVTIPAYTTVKINWPHDVPSGFNMKCIEPVHKKECNSDKFLSLSEHHSKAWPSFSYFSQYHMHI